MAVVLRLKMFGGKKKPFYRVVAITKSAKRDGKTLDVIGHYDPKKGKDEFTIDMEKVDYWIKNGAKPSDTVRDMIARHTVV